MIDPAVFIAPRAIVLGDVDLGADSSVWYNTVIRGDTERIRIGEGTNLQDFTMVHADPGIPCLIGSGSRSATGSSFTAASSRTTA